MKIGIISDSHDHIENQDMAIEMLKKAGAEQLIHCGDLCAPFMIDEIEKHGIPAHVVFGNIDDRASVAIKSTKSNIVEHYGNLAELNLAGKKIAVTHFPEFAFGLASTDNYDSVFHGHTHTQRNEIIGKTLLLNPGEIMGKNGAPSMALYDTETGKAEFLRLS